MTEHCVNNGTSICQTRDATHLIVTFEEFRASKTVGFTYSGERCELEFHLACDARARDYRLSLCVTSHSADWWHILIYQDPFNNDTEATVQELPPKEDIYLYSIRESSFGESDELIIFFRLDRDAEMLLSEEIDREQLVRLFRSLESLQQDAQFADMTVNGVPAHRAVLAAASHALHHSVAELVHNQLGSTSTDDDVCQSRAKKRKVVGKTQQIDCEAMEFPQPENYTLNIRELLTTHTGSFLMRYIYAGGVVISDTLFDSDSLAPARSLIAVAVQFNIQGLVNAVKLSLKNHLDVDKTSSYLKEIMDLAASYELHDLQVKGIEIMRSSDFVSRNVETANPAFLKYLLSVQSNRRHRRKVKHTTTIPDVYKMRYGQNCLLSHAIHICRVPLLIRVGYSDALTVFLELKDLTKSVCVTIDVSLLAKDKVCPKIRSQFLFNSRNSVWEHDLIYWDSLVDSYNGYVDESGSVKILTCVALKDK